jgi:hypothetical protein
VFGVLEEGGPGGVISPESIASATSSAKSLSFSSAA